jgi:hypothetical protein
MSKLGGQRRNGTRRDGQWISVRLGPIASGANPRGANVSVAPAITVRKNPVKTTSATTTPSRE